MWSREREVVNLCSQHLHFAEVQRTSFCGEVVERRVSVERAYGKLRRGQLQVLGLGLGLLSLPEKEILSLTGHKRVASAPRFRPGESSSPQRGKIRVVNEARGSSDRGTRDLSFALIPAAVSELVVGPWARK